MFKIAVLISGGGSNLQSIIDSIENGQLECKIDLIISDRECSGLKRGEKHGIETLLLDRKQYKDKLSAEIDKNISKRGIDLIVLAGYLSIIDSEFIAKWENKIINIHPSLLPKHGGVGMYGIKVHRSVIEAKDEYSGCSVHYVTDDVDGGEIIDREVVEVSKNDDENSLQKKVLEKEHVLLPRAIKKIIEERAKNI